MYIQWPDGTSESHAIPTGLFSSNYRAEIAAPEEPASILKNHSKTLKYRVVLLTDAKSVLQALTSAKCPLTEQLLAALCQIHSIALTVVQWIPGHSNIPGNDQADSLAKEGAKLPQRENEIDLPEIKTITKSMIRQRWKIQTTAGKTNITYSPDLNKSPFSASELDTTGSSSTCTQNLKRRLHQTAASANKQLRPQPISCSSAPA